MPAETIARLRTAITGLEAQLDLAKAERAALRLTMDGLVTIIAELEQDVTRLRAEITTLRTTRQRGDAA